MCTTSEDVPYKNPENVVGRGTTPNNLVIRWTPMPPIEQNGEHFFYKVFWKRDDDPTAMWDTKQINDWKEASHTIENQPTFRPYRIKVEAHNRRGQAHISAIEVIGYSGEDKPLETPRNFQLLEIRDARSAVFHWEPVSPDSVRGHFRSYKIQTWAQWDDDKHISEVTIPPNVTQAIVQVLKPFSKNYAKIIVFNDAFTSDPSNEIVVFTPEGKPCAVGSLEGISMGSNALYLFWARPEEPNGILTGYRIFYEKVEATESSLKLERSPPIEGPLITGAKLAGLKPGTKYRITIYATTRSGLGDPFYVEIATKPEDSAEVPDKPVFDWYHVKNIDGEDEVRVTWHPNSGDGKKPGSYFYVQYRLKGSGQYLSTPKDQNQDSNVVYIKGLNDDKTYEIRVVAVDGPFETPSQTKEISPSRIISRSHKNI